LFPDRAALLEMKKGPRPDREPAFILFCNGLPHPLSIFQ